MSLATANGSPAAAGEMPTVLATTIIATATPSATAAAPGAPVAGVGDNTEHATTSSTVMIVIGCIVGILGVAGVITLIWWMRKRALAQQTYMPTDLPVYHAPKPPPKGAPVLTTQKSLPQINGSVTRTERSGTVGSVDKHKALPIKPLESVWSPSAPKSPALSSVHEVNSAPRGRSDEEKAQARERSTSVGSYKSPQEMF